MPQDIVNLSGPHRNAVCIVPIGMAAARPRIHGPYAIPLQHAQHFRYVYKVSLKFIAVDINEAHPRRSSKQQTTNDDERRNLL